MCRSVILSLAAGIMVFAAVSLCSAAPGEIIANAEFADVLVDVLDLEMPPGTENLSEAELFEIQANILAEAGINMFVDLRPYAPVERSSLCAVLKLLLLEEAEEPIARGSLSKVFNDALGTYSGPITEDALIGYSRAITGDVADYLQGWGCMDPETAGDAMTFEEVIAALNIPALSTAIAEGYSSPGTSGTGGGGASPNLNGPGVTISGQSPFPEDPPEELAASPVI